MQKNKPHILSTGPLPERLIRNVAADITLDVVPFIQTSPAITEKTAAQIKELFQNPITAVFTSTNAVTAVAQLFQKPMPWKVYSIGSATANTITQLFQIPISGAASDAAALAQLIISDGIREVVFFCGNLRRDVLPETLQKANIMVTEIVVYQTVETPQVVTASYDGILFYSPSGVRSFFSVNKISSGKVLFAIGNTTAEALTHYTKEPIVVVQQPDKEDLLQRAVAYFNIKKEKTG